ncbi:MAG: DUF6456 domain-containing protein [Nitratireductor sp.]
MSAVSVDGAQRQLLRLLKCLRRSASAMTASARDDGRLELSGPERHLVFPATTVGVASKAGLVSNRDGKLHLTAAGRSYLLRQSDPVAGAAAQHRSLAQKTITHNSGFAEVSVNEFESPLSRLHSRKDKNGKSWIDADEFAAGERIRADFERAGLSPRITAGWDTPTGGRSGPRNLAGELSDFALDAKRRLHHATDMLGPELAGTVLDICCFLKGLEQVERERSWPPRSAKLMLRTALRMLAIHYGITGDRRQSAPMKHWGTDDYRPKVAVP